MRSGHLRRRGVSAYLGGYLPRQPPADTHPLYTTPQTDACENITFPHTSYPVGKNSLSL